MKIRIFALARDLGLDSKVLIDLAEEAGVKLRNALATISEEERDQIIAYLRRKGTPGASEVPTTDIAPVRETQGQVGRVRVIGASGRGTMRSADDQAGDLQGAPLEAELDEAVPVALVSDDGGEVLTAAESAGELRSGSEPAAEPVDEPVADTVVAAVAEPAVAVEVPAVVAEEPAAVAPAEPSVAAVTTSGTPAVVSPVVTAAPVASEVVPASPAARLVLRRLARLAICRGVRECSRFGKCDRLVL